VLRSDVEADADSKVLRSLEYPQHKTMQSEFHDQFGSGSQLTVTYTGLPETPDLVCIFRLYLDQPWGDLQVKVVNTTERAITVQTIRSLHATDAPVVNLGGPASADRILSDSYSEDRPQLAILDLGNGRKGMHRAVGSQLIYNRQSGQSLFLGALTSDRLLTIFHLKEQTAGGTAQILSYEAEATGTTEIMKEESLRHSPAAEQVSLSLPVGPGIACLPNGSCSLSAPTITRSWSSMDVQSGCCIRLESTRRLQSGGGVGLPIILDSTREPP